MFDIEKVLEMWKKDSIIDEHQLDTAQLDSIKIHGKYLELLALVKLELKKRDQEFKILLKKKFLYYNGKMSKSDIDAEGWEYDPFKGVKVLKGEMNYYYDSDVDIQKMLSRIEYLKTLKETLEEIISVLRWRANSIKNVIDFRRFMSGA